MVSDTRCYVASWDGDERACYITVELQCPRVLFMARRLGLQGRWGRPAAGLRPRPAREKGFPSNLLLD